VLSSDTAAGVMTWPAEALIDPAPYLCSLDCPSQPVFTVGGGSRNPKRKAGVEERYVMI
jgi:hydroxymethylglutaryl-CoA reductase